mmetsp:Transcript_2936/g.5064  ORF Transcript_2936/g.5064 Transcript_2936/m.5064 type:complete len:108 (+) Transcript_2936:702-1025(+)
MAVGAERFPPFDQQRIDRAAKAVRSQGGDGALLDAAGIAAFFSAMTIMVDATGHKNPFINKARGFMDRLVKLRKKFGRCLVPGFFFLLLLVLLGLCTAIVLAVRVVI